MHDDELPVPEPLVRGLLADQAPHWPHGDIAPGNLVERDGRLVGALDWGGAGVGDPAADLGIAWNFVTAPEREVFRAALADDDATLLRARGCGRQADSPRSPDAGPALAPTPARGSGSAGRRWSGRTPP